MFIKHEVGVLWAQQISDKVIHTVFYSLLNLIFGMSSRIWHSVSTFPENFKTNVIPCLLQLQPKAVYKRFVHFIFWWGWRPANPSFSMIQLIPSNAGSSGNSCFMGIVMASSTKQLKPLLNMPSVLIILATTLLFIQFKVCVIIS